MKSRGIKAFESPFTLTLFIDSYTCAFVFSALCSLLSALCSLSPLINTKGRMKPGEDQQGNRPGSYVLVLKTYQSSDDPNRWEKVFFCEAGGWVSPNGYWQIVYVEPDKDGGTGECYIDWGPNNSNRDFELCSYGGAPADGTGSCGYSCDYDC